MMDRLPVLYRSTLNKIDNQDIGHLIYSCLASLYYNDIEQEWMEFNRALPGFNYRRVLIQYSFMEDHTTILYDRIHSSNNRDVEICRQQYDRLYKEGQFLERTDHQIIDICHL